MTEVETVVSDWFEKFWNKRSPAIARKLADEKTIFNNPDATEDAIKGVSNFLKLYAEILEAFPDFKFHIEEMISSGDIVALRWTGKATHKGIWMGRVPTNKKLKFSGMSFGRVRKGKVVESWDQWDRQGVLAQIDRALSASRH